MAQVLRCTDWVFEFQKNFIAPKVVDFSHMKEVQFQSFAHAFCLFSSEMIIDWDLLCEADINEI